MAESRSPDLDELRGHFERFAANFPDLALYHRLAVGCAQDNEISSMLVHAQPGQARPVLLFAAVHDLVLRRPDLALARWYKSGEQRVHVDDGDVWTEFRATCMQFRDELIETIATHATQTNEVNRSTLVAALLCRACEGEPDTPVSLVELGASAGLLLGVDRYRIDIGESHLGDPNSSVRCVAEHRGDDTFDEASFPSQIVERVGIDQHPVDVHNVDQVRWLEACLWPDQPWRIERFRSAVAVAKTDSPRVVQGDFVAALPGVVADLRDDTHVVVFTTWALTYVQRERRDLIARCLEELAQSGRPVSWLSAEPPGCVPQVLAPKEFEEYGEGRPDTVLGLRTWRHGTEREPQSVGWSHPHGNWIHLT